MALKFALVLLTISMVSMAKDDSKWVWGDNNREKSSGRFFDSDGPQERYEVFEGPERPPSRPIYNQGGYERPIRPDFGPVERPGGIYGNQNRPGLGPIHRPEGVYGGQYPESNPGILTGPVPSWVQQGPYKNFDKCKCTEKFNCNSNGISYGHCDVGKSYCCYASKKIDQLGGPNPSRPVHSIENGVLAGPGGPVDFNNRPNRPGYNPGPSYGNRPGGYGPISNRPVHSIDNGILVGPGGPFDRPGYGGGRPIGGGGYGGGYGRSGKSEQ